METIKCNQMVSSYDREQFDVNLRSGEIQLCSRSYGWFKISSDTGLSSLIGLGLIDLKETVGRCRKYALY